MLALVYASRAVAPLDERELEEMLVEARSRNEAAGVTGMLLYAHGSFMQLLEGEADAVDAIYDSIRADGRHTDLRLLAREPAVRREFEEWWMGFEHPDDDRLTESLPGYKASTTYPLVNADLVHDATVARTLLRLYARNR